LCGGLLSSAGAAREDAGNVAPPSRRLSGPGMALVSGKNRHDFQSCCTRVDEDELGFSRSIGTDVHHRTVFAQALAEVYQTDAQSLTWILLR